MVEETTTPSRAAAWCRRSLTLACVVGCAAALARGGWRLSPGAEAPWQAALVCAVALATPGMLHRLLVGWRGARLRIQFDAWYLAFAFVYVLDRATPLRGRFGVVSRPSMDAVFGVVFGGLLVGLVASWCVASVRERIRAGRGSPITPAQIFFLSFLLVILLGTFALMLPRSQREGGDVVGWVDALFTSTSAVCVTGLATFDVGSELTHGGQGVLLLLIQLGGLGLMTYVAFFSLLLGRGMAASQHAVMREMVTSRFASGLRRAVLAIVGLTLALEAAGAGLLYVSGAESTGGRVWASVFHSVSAFCNAGFALWPANLMTFDRQPLVLGTVAALVVLGGLGFAVLMDLARWVARRRTGDLPARFSRLTLHTRIVVLTSAALLVIGAAGFLACEWNGTLAGYGWGHRLSNALFHSAMTRTAGFNAVDMGKVGEPGLLLTIGLMFIGASPGSTGGGLKTTTLVVLIAAVRALAANRSTVHVLGRSLATRVVHTALVLLALGTAAVFAGTLALSILEPHVPALKLVFEAVSALGTVGLSTGITPSLCPASKLVLCVLMIVGRVGPVTLLFSMAGAAQAARYEYAEEDVLVG